MREYNNVGPALVKIFQKLISKKGKDMIDKLFSSVQKPALWQRSNQPFWDDEHISKQMLEAHQQIHFALY